MFATVKFYTMPGAMSTQEYPIMSPGQDLSNNLLASIPDVKVTRDLLQAVGPIPTFTGYDTANIAEIDGRFYWVASFTTRTLHEVETVTFGLIYNAPTSQLRLGQFLTGVFSRTPSMTCDYLSMSITNDALAASRHIDLPNLGTYRQDSAKAEEKLYWVEVLASGTSSSAKSLHRFGFFATFDPVSMLPSTTAVCVSSTSDSTTYYPTIDKVIADPEIFGIQADQIVQIAVSERCPYTVSRTTAITGKNCVRLSASTRAYSGYQAYTNSKDWFGTYWPSTTADPANMTLTLTDMERAVGSVRMITESGSAIATIPTQYGSTIVLQVRTLDDYTGMSTEIIYNGRVLCAINEGHLPWVGNAWLEYQARQMEYDRTMVSMANNQARADMEISLRQSELNQVMSQINSLAATNIFSPGSFIAAGLGIIEADVKGTEERRAMQTRTGLETLANDTKQMLTEKKVKAEPGTAYSMGYGTIYLTNTYLHPARLQVEMPVNMTAQYYNDYTAEFGWPAEGKQTVTLSPGYIQGKLINTGAVTGYAFDELQRALADGLKMKAIT